MTDQKLSPAEAAFLIAPKARTGHQCLEAGLLALLGAGRVRVEGAAGMFSEPALVLEPSASGAVLPRHVAAIEQALAGYGSGNRLTRTQVLHALQKRFGYGYGRFVHEEIAPALIGRGLVGRTDGKWLGIFPRIRYARTPAGDAMAAPLERLMAEVERFPSLIESDPDAAIRLARSAGVLLVMSPKARRQIPALRTLLAERGDDSAAVIYASSDTGPDRDWELGVEGSDMALSFELDALFDGLDAASDFTSGGDGGSSDGGDGGGGGD